eukprot:2095695-Pyramimonas_sp.AAC.1
MAIRGIWQTTLANGHDAPTVFGYPPIATVIRGPSFTRQVMVESAIQTGSRACRSRQEYPRISSL